MAVSPTQSKFLSEWDCGARLPLLRALHSDYIICRVFLLFYRKTLSSEVKNPKKSYNSTPTTAVYIYIDWIRLHRLRFKEVTFPKALLLIKPRKVYCKGGKKNNGERKRE